MPSETTVTHVNEKSVRILTTGNEKKRFTVMLGCFGDGTKLSPYVIFKRKTMPKLHFPKGIIVRVHEKGWMDESLMKEWLRLVWGRRQNTRQRSLLVLDSFRCHRTESVKNILKDDNTDLAIIPGGMTSMLQPLDVGINKPMKSALRRKWNGWMSGDEHTFTKGGRMRKPEMNQICEWILQAWEELDPQIIIRSFLKCSLTNKLDGTEDDALWQNDEMSSSEIGDDDDDMDIFYNEENNIFDAETFFMSEDDDDEFLGFTSEEAKL